MEQNIRFLLCLHLLTAGLGEFCQVNQCRNGGTCMMGEGRRFICICPDGFNGETCNETESGPCSRDPCQNDGVCQVTSSTRRGDVFSEYICECAPGFEGVHCQNRVQQGADLGMQTDVNKCAGQPCGNGGICRDLEGDFKCHCPSPYVGKHCQLRKYDLNQQKDSINAGANLVHHHGHRHAEYLVELLIIFFFSHSNFCDLTPVFPWQQVNMQRKMRLTGIVTQGASRIGSAEYIKVFKVASGLDGRTFTMYRTEGETRDHVFVGNVDNEGTKTNLFDPPLIAQFIRVIPVVCRKACTLRMELVGCELNGCSEPMGIKSRLVSNRQITGSSTFRTWGMDAFTWHPHFARLDKQGKTNAWTAATDNRSEWLQVDLESPKKISGIITQGAKDFGSVQFVSAFKVAHSDDGQTWTIVKDETTRMDKIFPGNSDNNVHKKNIFDPPIYGRYLRILPWEWHGRITLRVELLGCDE
eukprot:XP_011605439.1 PREDICTED: lactadherin-like [Takifugu rubripes]